MSKETLAKMIGVRLIEKAEIEQGDSSRENRMRIIQIENSISVLRKEVDHIEDSDFLDRCREVYIPELELKKKRGYTVPEGDVDQYLLYECQDNLYVLGNGRSDKIITSNLVNETLTFLFALLMAKGKEPYQGVLDMAKLDKEKGINGDYDAYERIFYVYSEFLDLVG